MNFGRMFVIVMSLHIGESSPSRDRVKVSWSHYSRKTQGTFSRTVALALWNLTSI